MTTVNLNLRLGHSLGALLCFGGFVNALYQYQHMAFGLTATHFVVQSGTAHLMAAVSPTWGRPAPMIARTTIVGLGIGVCLLLHFFTRISYREDYLEYIAGIPSSSGGDSAHVLICHVVTPVLTLLHLVDGTFVDLVPLAAAVIADVSLIAVAHQLLIRSYRVTWVYAKDIRTQPPLPTDVVLLYAFSVLAAGSAALFVDTLLREREKIIG